MKVDRLVSLIMVLLDRKRLGARELADMFEVSPRTIYRDMDTISMAGIPVRSTPGAGGGFEIMPGFKIDNRVFTAADLSAILTGLNGLSRMMGGEGPVNALAKVRSFIPADRAGDIELKTNQIRIDLSPWMGNRNIQAYLEMIRTALQERRVLTFEYANRYGEKTVRTAEPCQLVLKGSHWYWQGFCRRRNDYRLFKLTRMSNLEMEEVFEPRDYGEPQLDMTDLLTSLQGKITIRIHKSVMDRVLDYCSPGEFPPDGEEHYILPFPFIENDYYYDILLSFGDRCECLSPPRVRTEMKRRIGDMAAIYKD